jgi:hypothetical protein
MAGLGSGGGLLEEVGVWGAVKGCRRLAYFSFNSLLNSTKTV